MKTPKVIYGIVLVLTCGLVATLKAQDIYVANDPTSDIGEYTTSGVTVNSWLISDLDDPAGIAILGTNLFVVTSGDGTIAEYTTSGQVINATLISGLNWPEGIAISGNDLFVVNTSNGTVGEYTTSGATVNATLISGLDWPEGIAISGNDLFVANSGNGTIGEYTTSGVTVNASLISGLGEPAGIAISGNDLFVADGNVGEYTTSGKTVKANLIAGLDAFCIAVLGNDLFVENGLGIGKYTTSGATVNASLITFTGLGLGSPAGIAISPPPLRCTGLRLMLSGMVEYQKADGENTVLSRSLDEKTVYNLISNYVANVASYSYGYIAGTNLPADGYVAFEPNSDTFYVTNNSGFSYQLNGHDNNGQFYSWIELDSEVFYGNTDGYLDFGPSYETADDLFNHIAYYDLGSGGDGSDASTSMAVLYIHDDPYAYDDADNPYVYKANYNPWIGAAQGNGDDAIGYNKSMIEIRGILKTSLTFKNFAINGGSFSLSGAGNFYDNDIFDISGVVSSGKAMLVP